MAPPEDEMVPLPESTYAIMVHKLYVERVIDFLLRNGGWNTATKAITQPSSSSNSKNVRVLNTQVLTGVSRARRGFVLLLVENVKRPVELLPPMARQNVSWAGRITHQSHDKTLIWSTMERGSSKGGNQFVNEDKLRDSIQLRVDVYPRDKTEYICLALQTCCAKSLGRGEVPTDPFEGPISMTMSASKCSHRLTVVFAQNCYYWGLVDRTSDSAFMNTKLNHEAADEIMVEAADSGTGKEVKPDVDVLLPLSRAYYKMEQVWHDYLMPEQDDLQLHRGIDLGASPGGWTQVLVHQMGLSRVLAVDPGRPADRILTLPQVTHIKSDIISSVIDPQDGPLSVVVCDASEVWIELMKQLEETVAQKCKWALPSVWVITLKLPFKTLGSVQRHVDMIYERIPSHLEGISAKMYPGDKVQARFQIAHLMANSDSERTLIVIFEKSVDSISGDNN
jgi:hypothetical protein